MVSRMWSAFRAVLFFTVLTGVLYPGIMTPLLESAFPQQAQGTIITRADGTPIGSGLLGQDFSDPRYFHPRPSAAGTGYDALASGGSNLAPTNRVLFEGSEHGTAGVSARARQYRSDNSLPADAVLPPDAVTSSASGLDPHISPENAELQVRRVAAARRLGEQRVLALVEAAVEPRQWGIFGEPRVNVLRLNQLLESLRPESARQ